MPVKDVLIRAQELGGRWTVLGSDSARGITVEDLNCDADTWGSRGCSFTLRRNGRVPWPDIGAFAPIEIESQGLIVWTGRVKGTPTTDGSDRRMTVNGEGWQYHLDDDSYQRNYVHPTLTDFVDARSLLLTPLATWRTNGQVQVGEGLIMFGWGNGAALAAGDQVGVTLDFGPSLCKRVYVAWQSSNNYAAGFFYLRGSETPDGGYVTYEDLFPSPALNNGGATGSYVGSFVTPHRYIHLLQNTSTTTTIAADVWFRITALVLFGDATYESSSASNLKASTVIADARTKSTLLLASDTSKIAATSFNIPDFAMSKPDTPRNVINAVNTYHAYQSRVTVDKVLEFRALPANAAIQVDARSEFDEASAGDASEIYSGAIVTYTAADGSAGSTARNQASSLTTLSGPQPTNPGAEVNTTGWTSISGTLSRDTVIFDTGVGSFKIAGNNLLAPQTSAWTAALTPSRAYTLTLRVRADTLGTINCVITDVAGSSVYGSSTITHAINTWTTMTVTFSLPLGVTAPLVYLTYLIPGTGVNGWVDSLILTESAPTVVDRRGFKRTFTLDTNMSLTAAAAQQIGDVFLTQHKTTPLKGKVVCSGYGAASKSPSGVNMPPAELLLNTGELVRLAHLIDPDTGNIGREGRIAAASWDAASDTTTLELDSQVNNFEAFLGRLGILTGAVK